MILRTDGVRVPWYAALSIRLVYAVMIEQIRVRTHAELEASVMDLTAHHAAREASVRLHPTAAVQLPAVQFDPDSHRKSLVAHRVGAGLRCQFHEDLVAVELSPVGLSLARFGDGGLRGGEFVPFFAVVGDEHRRGRPDLDVPARLIPRSSE